MRRNKVKLQLSQSQNQSNNNNFRSRKQRNKLNAPLSSRHSNLLPTTSNNFKSILPLRVKCLTVTELFCKLIKERTNSSQCSTSGNKTFHLLTSNMQNHKTFLPYWPCYKKTVSGCTMMVNMPIEVHTPKELKRSILRSHLSSKDMTISISF